MHIKAFNLLKCMQSIGNRQKNVQKCGRRQYKTAKLFTPSVGANCCTYKVVYVNDFNNI